MTAKVDLSAETKYGLLLEIEHKVRGTLDLDSIMNHLLDTIGSVMDYDAAGIFILNRGAVLPHRGPPGNVIAGIALRGFDLGPPEADPMLSEGKGVIGRVIRTGETVLISDVAKDPDYIAGRKRTRSEVAVPICHQDRVIGALNVESDRPGAFSERDLGILNFFADATGISIERAVLHRQILEKKCMEEQLRLARDVQARLLPAAPPGIAGYDIDGLCIPAYEIGGDSTWPAGSTNFSWTTPIRPLS
ncbi:MAG: GAF domain-containing protein [Acidobacteriota bacterium]